MKRNLLFLSIMVICTNLIFANPLDTRKQIRMKVRVRIEHRSMNRPEPVQVNIYNSLLEMNFEYPTDNVTILIVNSKTGETIHSEKLTSNEKNKLINLVGFNKNTEYTLKVSSPLWESIGDFIIEE